MACTVYYFDAGRGISGDMVVAALLDLSQDKKGLEKVLAALPLKGAQIQIGRVNSHGIEATDFDVRLPKPAHEHEAGHAHMHRNLADVESVIDAAPLSERAAELAKKIFRIVAEAEARVHGKSVSDVHFHEVGALDSIADIVSAAYLIDQLGMEQIAFSPLAEGTGSVMCQHGWLPVPVPVHGMRWLRARMIKWLCSPADADVPPIDLWPLTAPVKQLARPDKKPATTGCVVKN